MYLLSGVLGQEPRKHQYYMNDLHILEYISDSQLTSSLLAHASSRQLHVFHRSHVDHKMVSSAHQLHNVDATTPRSPIPMARQSSEIPGQATYASTQHIMGIDEISSYEPPGCSRAQPPWIASKPIVYSVWATIIGDTAFA